MIAAAGGHLPIVQCLVGVGKADVNIARKVTLCIGTQPVVTPCP